MLTYNFQTQDIGSIRVNVDGIYKRTLFGMALIEVIDNDTFDIIDRAGGRHRYELTLKELSSGGTTTTPNAFELNGVDISGTVENICIALSGGTVATGWDLSINNAGALVTTEGTPFTAFLISPDSSVWSVTVNNAGALVTTKVTGQTGVERITKTSPDNSVWAITINNSGALITTKL